MFDSALYDPNAPWRSEPATEAQYEFLEDLDIHARRGLTKGEASDLISSAIEPDVEQIEFLRSYDVTLRDNATQLDANRKIAEIVAHTAYGSARDARNGRQGGWTVRVLFLLFALAVIASCNSG
jgi:hypothetical protein